MINLRHIEVFHAVYQTGSLSGAARLLGVSQPSVSKVLRHAESRLGFPLFRIVKGRLIATDEAHLLFEEANAVQARVATLHEAAKNLKRADQGRIRVALIHSLGLGIVPQAIARFAARYPRVAFDVRTLHTEELAAALHERSSDLAIGYDTSPHPRLANIRLGSGELVALFRREDFADPPERLSFEALETRRVIRLVNDGTIGSLLNRRLEKGQDDWAPIQVKTYFVAAALVREGLGVAVMDEFTARGCLTHELDFRPLTEPMRFDVMAAHLEDQPLSTAARHFLDHVRTTLAEAKT